MKEDLVQQNSDKVVSLSDEAEVKKVLVDTVLGLWQIVNNLTRLRPSKRDRFRVSIFGSARVGPNTIAFEEVKRMASVLTTMGCDVITGGGPGLMLAANEGAAAGSSNKDGSVGIRVDLPFEQEVNPFVNEVYEHGTFFTRLHHFVLTSDAFVVTPGGIGTLLEAAMIWQLLQVRHIKDVPLIFIGKMWNDLVEWAKNHMLTSTPQLISPEDISIALCVKDADEAIALLQDHHKRWLIANKTGS